MSANSFRCPLSNLAVGARCWLLNATHAAVASIVAVFACAGIAWFARASTPAAPTDILELQDRIRSTIEHVRPAVVGIDNGGGSIGSTGIIISADGLVLLRARTRLNRAGDRMEIRFHDGTTRSAVLVGADESNNLSLLQLSGGPFPFCPLASDNPRAGERVLKFGYLPHRIFPESQGPLASLGTILTAPGRSFVSDLRCAAHDSGAPILDLNGRVVGILHEPVKVLDRANQKVTWSHNVIMPRGGFWWRAASARTIRDFVRRAKDRPRNRGGETEALRELVGEFEPERMPVGSALIPEDQRTQGAQSRERWRNVAERGRGSVVELLDGDDPAAFGTVVDHDLVLTKASETPQPVRCRLSDGRILPADIVGLDPDYDLTLIRVPGGGLAPIVWDDAGDLPCGTAVAAVGPGALPFAIGITGVSETWTGYRFEPEASRYENKRAGMPSLTGRTLESGGFCVETAAGAAAAAGIQPGDLILRLGDTPISRSELPDDAAPAMRAHWALRLAVARRIAGERVAVQLLRGGRKFQLELRLSPIADCEPGFQLESRRTGTPPSVFVTDIPALANECGAPVMNEQGRAVGLLIRRFGIPGSFVIPAATIKARLRQLRVGQPFGSFEAVRLAAFAE